LEFRFSLSPTEILNFVKVWTGKLKIWLNKEDSLENSNETEDEKGLNFS